MNRLMGPRECKEHLQELGVLVVVPTFNNAGTVGTLMAQLITYASDILVVDDGCTDGTEGILGTFGFREIDAAYVNGNESGGQRKAEGRTVLRHSRNMGKGRSLKDALVLAGRDGWKYVLTIDADGQHFPSDIPSFVEAAMQTPETLLTGCRNLQSENMPSRNTFANRFSNFWFRFETGVRLEDTQCGFRLYPLGSTDYSRWYYTSLYEFELEAIVFAAWSGVPVRGVPVSIYYPPAEERVSHFRPLRYMAQKPVEEGLLEQGAQIL